MKYYSTNKQAPMASLQEAVVKGLAADRGLFMPMTIKPLPQDFYDTIDTLSFQEIAYRVDRKSTRLNSSHTQKSRMPSSA